MPGTSPCFSPRARVNRSPCTAVTPPCTFGKYAAIA
jgi:hypothetical protein